MAPVQPEELESWQTLAGLAREHLRKINRAVLTLDQALLTLQVQLSDARQPTLLDELPSPDEAAAELINSGRPV